jgi:hypothetical protein
MAGERRTRASDTDRDWIAATQMVFRVPQLLAVAVIVVLAGPVAAIAMACVAKCRFSFTVPAVAPGPCGRSARTR